ncbi:MAG: DUF362 domain-containing protein [Candidatus Hodarchaeota archaeon]
MSVVAAVKTTPKTIFDDIEKAMELGGLKKTFKPDIKTILKLNLSWSLFYPACSTHPYIFDGLMKYLINNDFSPEKIVPIENETVVTKIDKGLKNNRWNTIIKRYNLKFESLTETKWVRVKLKKPTLKLEEIFGQIIVPENVLKAQILHLPTIKCHGHSEMTGALKNAFGMLLKKVRFHSHLWIHEILTDLLLVQKEVCGPLFALTDGTIIGDGAGPRTHDVKLGNILLASSDMVSIDAIQCKVMGIPLKKVPKIKMCHDLGLGIGDLDQIEIVGDFDGMKKLPNFHTKTKMSPVIYWNRRLYNSPFKHILFDTNVFNIPVKLSATYHDKFWYPTKARKKIAWFMNTGWGKLFKKY